MKFNSEELHNLYSSPDIITQIKSRRMRWEGCVAHMEEKKVYRVWWESLKERDLLERQGVDVKMGSKWILGTLAGEVHRVDSAGSGQGPITVSCKYSDAPVGSGATELVR
jgi:hypothetical protein